jgi:acyl-CoA synthetase (AMP-forming)/AMP-acid ligase II
MNIAESFINVAKAERQRPAIIEAKSGRTLSFSEMQRTAERYAVYLERQGVKSQEVVMLMVTPSADFICLTLALFMLGAPIVLIDPGMGYKNLLRCIARVRPTVLIGIPKALLFAKLFRRAFATVRRSFCVGNSWGLLGADVRKVEVEEESTLVHPADKEALAAIIFTTGSTGAPKGVRYEHRIFNAQLQLIRDYYGIGARDVDQPAFPLFALFSAALGACSVIPDMDATRPAQVDPRKFVASIHRYQVTYSFGSPAIWNVVSRYCTADRVALPSLRKILMAGAPVPWEVLERTASLLHADAEIFTPYGATESLPVASISAREVLAETMQQSRNGAGTCVGRPLPGIDIRIMEISDLPEPQLRPEKLLGEGQIGEILVRGGVVTTAYYNNPEESALAKIADGDTFWHRMGDVGYLDDQGRLWFCGRRAHRLETEGGRMFTICCEAIVNEHPQVFRSALVAVRDDQGVTVPVIIVELVKDGSHDRRRIIDEALELCRAHPLTKEVRTVLIHPAFPVDIRHNAKIFREKLSLWAQQQLFPHP